MQQSAGQTEGHVGSEGLLGKSFCLILTPKGQDEAGSHTHIHGCDEQS